MTDIIFDKLSRLKISDDALLTVGDVAKLLKAKEKTVRQWVYKRKIPSLKLNGLLRFSRTEIENWINGLMSERQPCY